MVGAQILTLFLRKFQRKLMMCRHKCKIVEKNAKNGHFFRQSVVNWSVCCFSVVEIEWHVQMQTKCIRLPLFSGASKRNNFRLCRKKQEIVFFSICRGNLRKKWSIMSLTSCPHRQPDVKKHGTTSSNGWSLRYLQYFMRVIRSISTNLQHKHLLLFRKKPFLSDNISELTFPPNRALYSTVHEWNLKGISIRCQSLFQRYRWEYKITVIMSNSVVKRRAGCTR